MSVNNETMQVKPDFKIDDCLICPSECVCRTHFDHEDCVVTRKEIEVLVNGKR